MDPPSIPFKNKKRQKGGLSKKFIDMKKYSYVSREETTRNFTNEIALYLSNRVKYEMDNFTLCVMSELDYSNQYPNLPDYFTYFDIWKKSEDDTLTIMASGDSGRRIEVVSGNKEDENSLFNELRNKVENRLKADSEEMETLKDANSTIQELENALADIDFFGDKKIEDSESFTLKLDRDEWKWVKPNVEITASRCPDSEEVELSVKIGSSNYEGSDEKYTKDEWERYHIERGLEEMLGEQVLQITPLEKDVVENLVEAIKEKISKGETIVHFNDLSDDFDWLGFVADHIAILEQMTGIDTIILRPESNSIECLLEISKISKANGNTAFEEKEERVNLDDKVGKFVDRKSFDCLREIGMKSKEGEYTISFHLHRCLGLDITFRRKDIYLTFCLSPKGEPYAILGVEDDDEAWELFKNVTLEEVLDTFDEPQKEWLTKTHFNEKKKEEKLNLGDYLDKFVDLEDFEDMWNLNCSRKVSEFTLFYRLGKPHNLQLEITFCGLDIYVSFDESSVDPEVITTDDPDEAWERFSNLTLGDLLAVQDVKELGSFLGSYFNENKKED